MTELLGPQTLWAMHPAAMDNILMRDQVASLLPEGLTKLFSAGDVSAAKPVDPVRTGSSIIFSLMGTLTPRGSYGGTSTEKFAAQIAEAGDDDRIGTIIVKVMSPGGLVFGTQEAGDAVYAARQKKPVIMVADKYAFSAAHWIATQATAFYVTGSGQVGSVGVRGGHIDKSVFEDKIGFKTTLIASSPEKIAAHPYAPLSDEDRATIQADVDEMNGFFASAIARGRGIDVADVANIHGTGQVFSAIRAAKLGICDGVMSLNEVITKFSSSRARLDLMRKRTALQGQSVSI